VIFDLVEDGNGWVARGDLTGGRWAAGGLRMFNVGITRARQCESNLNGTRCDWRTPFADHPGARNQPKH
jgi:hypothetical protein